MNCEECGLELEKQSYSANLINIGYQDDGVSAKVDNQGIHEVYRCKNELCGMLMQPVYVKKDE